MSTITPWLVGSPADLVEVSAHDRHGKPLRTLVDLRTGLVRNDPVPSDAELAAFYARDYRRAYKGADRPRKRQAYRNFRCAAAFCEKFEDVILGAETILDAGAGSGEFLFLARALGKRARGIEPNEDYSAFCRDEYGLDVQTALLDPALFADASFDLIRLNHVLEHLNDPVKYLAMMARWLKPGGKLYVEVPNIEVYCRNKSKGGMFHYGHIYNFTPWTLRAVAALAGLCECETTAERSKDTAGAFFVLADPVPAGQMHNRQHALELRTLLQGHGTHGPPVSRSFKLIRKLSARVNEFVNIAGGKSYSDIGHAAAAAMKVAAMKVAVTNETAANTGAM